MNTTQDQLIEIGNRLLTQDNRCTANPMFCVQEKKRDMGYDANYGDDFCWYNFDSGEVRFTNPGALKGWEKFGYKDRWETVMVAFTEEGCKQYIKLNGHNHRGELRIYADSFNRCPEMIAIREWLMSEATKATGGTAS